MIKCFLGEDAGSGNYDLLAGDIIQILDAVDKMHRLLNELLELSRIGRLRDPSQPVAFHGLVNEAVEVLQGCLLARPDQIKIADDLPLVFGDRRRLVEVIQNLIDNAAKFCAGQQIPLVEIGTQGCERGMPVLFVSDNGIGTPSEHHERVFGLFNKLDPMAEGSGVGLALVKRIVEYHGGRI